MSGVVRVLLVDDHSIVRSGLKLLIESNDDLSVVGEASSGEEAETILAAGEPADVVLMDLMMDGIGGIEATTRVRRRWPGVAVVVLTMADDSAHLREAFAAGAAGYVLKDAAAAELAQAIRAVHDGGRYVHPALGAEVLRTRTRARPSSASDGRLRLSGREVDVLRLVARGYTNREIAEELVISVRTVETHKTHIIQKTGRRSRSELVRFAADEGLVQV